MEKYTLLFCFLVYFFRVKLFLIILFQKQLNVNRICEIVIMWHTLVYYYNYIDDYLVWPSIYLITIDYIE